MQIRPVQSGDIKMQLSKQLSAFSRQLSVKNQFGVGLFIVIAIVALTLVGAAVLTTPQIRGKIFPSPSTKSAASPSATPQLSDKQRLYLRNKATIQKTLNLNDEQFKLLLESADKN